MVKDKALGELNNLSIARSQHYYKRLSIYVYVWQATESMAYTGNYLWGYRLLVM